MFDGRWRSTVEQGVAPVGTSLGARRFKPDHLTALGLVMAVACAVVIATGHLLIGFVLLVLSALPDLLDGAIAKATGMSSIRGAFFDSVTDRVTDTLILGGIAWHLSTIGGRHLAMLPFAVLGTSTLISYQRAKAESLGLRATGGLMERAERIIALCIGLAFPVVLVPVLWVMLGLTSLTAIQRFVSVWRLAPGPAPSSLPPARSPRAESRAELRAASRAARHSTTTSRWREWREAALAERAQRMGLDGRWRSRMAGPRADRLTRVSAQRSWRRRDRTRP